MGVVASIIRFLRSPTSKKSSPSQVALAPRESPLHWKASGRFPISAVGESFYKDSIRKIAKNFNGNRALVLCTAVLLLDDNNEHDPNAVAVCINTMKVGHLSRQTAICFRNVLARNRIDRLTSCDAIIYGGGVIDEFEFDYSIELDLDLEKSVICFDAQPTHPQPVTLPSNPTLLTHTNTEFFLRVPYIDRFTLDLCSQGCALTQWEKPDGSEIHLFAPRSIGGTGRIAVLPKKGFAELVRGWDEYRYLTVHKITGRSIVVRGGTECDPKYAFKHRDYATVAIIHIDQRNPVTATVGVIMVHIDMGKGNGKVTVGSRPHHALFHLADSDVDNLKELVQNADVLVSYDMESQKNGLNHILSEALTEKPWGCLRTFWKKLGNADSFHSLAAISDQCNVSPPADDDALTQCQTVADVLLAHTGKTKRSRTYMVTFLRHYV